MYSSIANAIRARALTLEVRRLLLEEGISLTFDVPETNSDQEYRLRDLYDNYLRITEDAAGALVYDLRPVHVNPLGLSLKSKVRFATGIQISCRRMGAARAVVNEITRRYLGLRGKRVSSGQGAADNKALLDELKAKYPELNLKYTAKGICLMNLTEDQARTLLGVPKKTALETNVWKNLRSQ